MSKSVKTLAIASAVSPPLQAQQQSRIQAPEKCFVYHWPVKTIVPRVLHNMRRFIHS